ncbi:MAG: signal recognition particle-docking protein FtsY [Candidatus Woesearchaeota archaeon]
MFKFLKDKLKSAVSKFSQSVDQTAEEKTVEVEEQQEQPAVVEQKKETPKKPVKKKEPEKQKKETIVEKISPKKEEKPLTVEQKTPIPPPKEKPLEIKKEEKVIPTVSQKAQEKPSTSFFTKVTQTFTKKILTQEQFDSIFFELEMELLENNVAVQVIEKLKENLQTALVGKQISRSQIEELVSQTLTQTITQILSQEPIDLLKSTQQPLIIMVVGINGSGKTTTLAKLTHYFLKNNKSCVLGACDTFRAAAIDQLQEHATKLGVKLIRHEYGSDAAAVAYDAVSHAKSKKLDVVLLDTAGRLHSNTNLMDELTKLKRVVKPHVTIFVGESITGNDCVEQAQQFNDAIGIDAIILTKSDVDKKGGAALSISYVTQKPILFLADGQTYDDLQPFSAQTILDGL